MLFQKNFQKKTKIINIINFFSDIDSKKNSKAILKSSLIKLTWACAFVTSLHFKHMMSHAQKQPRLHLLFFKREQEQT
jgi:hypothetical protein